MPHESLTVFPYHLAVTGSTLAVCVCLSIWGTGSLKLLCSFYGLIVGTLAAIVVGIIGSAEWNQVARAAWVTVPSLGGLGLAFDWSLLPAFLAATVGVVVRSIALITTCQRQNDEAWERPDMVSLRKGVLADGLSNVFGGLLGAQGMNVFRERGRHIEHDRRRQSHHRGIRQRQFPDRHGLHAEAGRLLPVRAAGGGGDR